MKTFTSQSGRVPVENLGGVINVRTTKGGESMTRTWLLASAAMSTIALGWLGGSVSAVAADAPTDNTVEQIVVTGTSAARTILKTPMQSTTLDSQRLELLASNSAADLLTTIPTLKAEGGGGEVASNVFVAGLPSTGQYQFTPLEFNGMPVISSMGLNSNAPDIYQRPDLGVAKLEFVHGGVSNLFGGGSVGGLINYIDKTGTDITKGEARLELGDMGRVKTDFAASGAINKDAGLYYAISGWYRFDQGPLKSGLPTEGEQIRGNIRKEFEGGYVTLYGQYIDDRDQFYGDYPLTGSNYERPAGNNGKSIFTTETAALTNISFQTPSGTFRTNVADGVKSTGGSFGLDFKKDLGDGWGVNGRANFGNYRARFALFSGGDAKQNLPTTQSAFLQAYGYNPSLYTGSFTYGLTGKALPSNYLLWADRVIDRERPLETKTAELNITKEISAGGWDHHFTFGGFWGYSKASDRDIGYAYVGDFDNAPQLVTVTATNNATGAVTTIAQNGLLNTTIQYTNAHAEARRYAGYFADQSSFGRWEFDIGGRIETINGTVSKEGSANVAVNSTAGLSPLLSNVLWGNGVFASANVSTTSWALAGAALYRWTDHTSFFLNASRGYFMPQMNSVTYSTAGVQSYEPEIIKQVEAGVKYAKGPMSGSLSAFYSTLTDLRNINLVNSPTGGVAEVVNSVATRTYGVEGAVRYALSNGLSFDGNLTYQDDIYTQYSPVAACINCVNNDLQRQPQWTANAGVYYRAHGFDAALFDTFTGRTFTSDLNNIRLPSYHVVRFELGYTTTLRGGDQVRAGLNVYNLFDSEAVTEGSPRLGTLQNAGQAYFVGRTVLPRRVTFNLSYKF